MNDMNDLNNKDKSAELDGYKNALREAYPGPKTDIKAAVMAEISADGAKVLTKKPRSKLRTFVKWGSLAACIVLVGVICIRVLPMTKMFSESDNATGNTVPHENALDGMNYSKADTYSDSESSVGTIDAVIAELPNTPCEEATKSSVIDADDAIAPESGGEEIAEVEAPQAEQATRADSAEAVQDYTSTLPDAVIGEGESAQTDCAHAETFMNSYHDIPALLVNLVGESAYSAWLSSTDGECGANIASFIEYFALPREIFCELVNTTELYYLCDYPIELLYGGDAAAIEKYYAGGGNMQDSVCRYFEYKFKMAIASSEHVTGFSSWMRERGYSCTADWSIAELSHDMGITAAELEAIYTGVKSTFASIYEGITLPEYDFAAIEAYGERDSF